ncbi:MAG: radical SAM protein [Desulfurivibrionaceae bacterium]
MIEHKNTLMFFHTVGVKVTSKCNMKCMFCCEPKRNRPYTDSAQFIKILEIIKKAGGKKICITGGEPLLYSDICMILEYSSNIGLENVLLSADGKAFMEKKITLSKRDSVRFSIHGLKEKHNLIVGYKNGFENIETAVKYCVNNDWNVSVTTVVTNINYFEIDNIARWCINNGIRKYYLFGLMKSGNGNSFINKYGEVNSKLNGMKDKLIDNYSNSGMEIVVHSYTTNAECIIVYGDGEMIIDPYHNGAPYQKRIGNILVDKPYEIFENVMHDQNLSKDYLARLSRSNII